MTQSDWKIRRAVPQDARNIHEAHMRSIREVCGKDYTEIEIGGWGGREFRENERIKTIENDCIWVLESSNAIGGYCHLRFYENENQKMAELHALYFTPEALGKGLGKIMLDLIIAKAQEERVSKIELCSTLNAHEFYRRHGFSDTGPMIEYPINGVSVRCFPMEMSMKAD